jgi:hypothetical protein
VENGNKKIESEQIVAGCTTSNKKLNDILTGKKNQERETTPSLPPSHPARPRHTRRTETIQRNV